MQEVEATCQILVSTALDAIPLVLQITHAVSLKSNTRSTSPTYHTARLIPGIDNCRKREDTTDPHRDVGAIVTTVVSMVKLPDQVQFEPSVAHRLAPDLEDVSRHHQIPHLPATYIDNSSSMTGEEKISLQPFVVDTFVEHAVQYTVVRRFTSCLLH